MRQAMTSVHVGLTFPPSMIMAFVWIREQTAKCTSEWKLTCNPWDFGPGICIRTASGSLHPNLPPPKTMTSNQHDSCNGSETDTWANPIHLKPSHAQVRHRCSCNWSSTSQKNELYYFKLALIGRVYKTLFFTLALKVTKSSLGGA